MPLKYLKHLSAVVVSLKSMPHFVQHSRDGGTLLGVFEKCEHDMEATNVFGQQDERVPVSKECLREDALVITATMLQSPLDHIRCIDVGCVYE